jgi:F0F1-type ATP synthase gamma subunit
VASEHASRLVDASRRAQHRGAPRKQQTEFRRHQETITEALLDIVTGVEASASGSREPFDG